MTLLPMGYGGHSTQCYNNIYLTFVHHITLYLCVFGLHCTIMSLDIAIRYHIYDAVVQTICLMPEIIVAPGYHNDDDVIKWNYLPRYWPFVWGIHRSPVNSPHKGQRRGALVFSLICALNKWLSKQLRGWWFETPSCPLWRHCYVMSEIIVAPGCHEAW